MGFSLKSIGHALKNAVTAVSAPSHALYGALSGKGVTQIAKDYATDAGRAAAGAGVLGAGMLAAPALAGAGGVGGAAGAAGGGGALGLLKTVGSGLLQAAPLAVGAYSAYSGAQQAKAGQELQDEALALARARDAQFAPLRDAGIAAALEAFKNPVSPYAAAGGYVDAGNPYSVPLAGAPAPVRPLGGVTPLRLARGARAARGAR